ncbi:pectinesterase family protein [Epilithonimonas mollis]|uniref:Por secretion system C-terminal sorting domain-containing protein n=1 Tax=Epilithonimonas mollis TaxID=216903 RepID=A0A1M6NFQ9_9FLAO|nr:pectinesterase family protein [Epilithonimonas mollis]SHJ94436.1 Por secretion system C-terminal sorting domain-containing protein [Epilithonimonas mollis]
MKKNLLLPVVLFSTLTLFGIGKSVSNFSDSNNEKSLAETEKSDHLQTVKSEINTCEKSLFESTPASVTWPFITDITTKSLEGNLESSFSYPSASVSYQVNTKIDFTGDSVTDSNTVFWQGTSSNNSWTGTGDINVFNSAVYLQVDVNPTNGGTFTIDKIQGLVGAAGTGNMYYQAFYSLNSDFSSPVQIQTATKLPNNGSSALNVNLSSAVVLTGSQKLYVRFYPYLASSATNKQFGLRNIKISGTMEGAVANPATVSTTTVSKISTTKATSGGTISSNGGGIVTNSGVVWSTNQNPTISDSKTTEDVASGPFISNLTGLLPGTTYYVRAYATNSAGTSYGNQESFTTLTNIVAPSVTTVSQSQVTNKSFVISGNVTDWGGADVTERGIVYSTTPDPAIGSATKVPSGTGTGSFSSYAYGVNPATLYYVKTFATNSAGTTYGTQATVTTKVTDPDVLKTIAKDGSGDYTTVQAAFDAVPDFYTGRWIIHIKPGTYTERPTLNQNKTNVFLIGDDAGTTIITNNISAGAINPDTGQAYGTSNSQTMAIFGSDFTASKITVANTFVNSTANTQINSSTQAVALKTQGDRQSFYDCKIVGYQDTYLGNSIGRAYFKNCYIEGNVDFIFGRQTVIFDHCTTYINRNNSVVTAPSTEATTKFGFVFLDCNLTVPAAGTMDFNGTVINNFHFGRAWQNVPKSVFIRCETPSILNPTGWTTPINGTLPVIFAEYGNTGAGATPDRLTQRANGGTVLTENESQIYTIANVFKKETDPSFVFDWMPESSVNIDFGTLAVNNFGKGQALVYPNPFADQVKISYHLKSNYDISVSIYDMNGRIVKSIEKSNQKSGNNELVIDGNDLKPGIYFYSLKTDSRQINGKLIKK